MPAWLVFYVSLAFGLAGAGLTYFGNDKYLPFTVGACVLLLVVLTVNERNGFTRSRRLRRSGEQRVIFEEWEVAVLFILLLLDVFISVHAWVA